MSAATSQEKQENREQKTGTHAYKEHKDERKFLYK